VSKKHLNLRERVTGGWKNMHGEELQELFCSPNIRINATREMIRGTCSTHGVEVT
jgi:hypothetical protein